MSKLLLTMIAGLMVFTAAPVSAAPLSQCQATFGAFMMYATAEKICGLRDNVSRSLRMILQKTGCEDQLGDDDLQASKGLVSTLMDEYKQTGEKAFCAKYGQMHDKMGMQLYEMFNK